MDAVANGARQRRRALHDEERPIALLSSITLNSNRDPKKSKPINYESLCFYQDTAQQNLPDSRYGSAAMQLIEQREFPAWALFVYKDLQKVNSSIVPARLALRHPEALILAPTIENGVVTGMVIAQESVSKQWIEMTDDDGVKFLVLMPPVGTKNVALEDVEMPIRPVKG